MDLLPAIIFPHVYVDPFVLEKVKKFCDPVYICLPWYSTIPSHFTGESSSSHLIVLRPDEKLKPPEDFERLLKEYELWISQNNDIGLAKFLSVASLPGETNETIGKIKDMILNPEKVLSSQSFDETISMTLRAHLILHLSMENEQRVHESDEILDDIRSLKSPIADALGIDETSTHSDMFDDLPPSKPWSFISESLLEPVIESWIYLFGSVVPGDVSLLTFDPNIFQFLGELFYNIEDRSIIGSKINENLHVTEVLEGDVCFRKQILPELQKGVTRDKKDIITFLNGKTLILMEGRKKI